MNGRSERSTATASRRSTTRLIGALIAVALAAAGCVSAPPAVARQTLPDSSVVSPTRASPSPPTATLATGRSGCDGPPPAQTAGSTADESLTAGGRQRSYRLHLPAGYSPHRAYGLVLAFHGRGETDEQLESYSGLDALPAVVVYPQGLAGTAGRSGWEGTPYAAPGADDIGFAATLIARVQSTLCIDASKIDATGKSDGGGLAALLGCRLPDIDAIAPVSGAFYPALSACSPAHPVAVLNFHGTADPVIPYGGDARRNLLSVPAWLAGWVGRDGCAPWAGTILDRSGVQAQQWSGCRRGVVVQNYRITGGGHTWPGSAVASGPGDNTTAISATSVIGAFFAAH